MPDGPYSVFPAQNWDGSRNGLYKIQFRTYPADPRWRIVLRDFMFPREEAEAICEALNVAHGEGAAIPREAHASWSIEWFVPPVNAIGSKGYWVELEGGRFADEAEARKAFARAEPRPVRLVKVTREVLEEQS